MVTAKQKAGERLNVAAANIMAQTSPPVAPSSATLSQITEQKGGSGGDDSRGERCHTQRTVATSLPDNLSLKPNTGTEAFLPPLAWLPGVCFTCHSSVALLFILVTSASLCPVAVGTSGVALLFFIFRASPEPLGDS